VSRILAKVGGASAKGAAALIHAYVAEGHEVCVVHGAGPQITAELVRRGIEVEFVAGRRVTTAAVLDVVRESLAEVNAALVHALGDNAIGFCGDALGVTATQVAELGLVGEPAPCAPPALVAALAHGAVPVVAPLALNADGTSALNVNADEMATALAVGLDADRISFLTDVPGLLLGGAVVSQIDAADAEALLTDGTLEGGILPKLRAAIAAARLGVDAEIGETAVVA
jgi:acetylglutamate kinase